MSPISFIPESFNLNRSERLIAVFLFALWALICLPNLRTNPNWYGDEGIVLEEARTLAQGTPRYGPMTMNFLSPNPHPPLYLMVLGGAMSLFGNDILVGRSLQALTGLATAVVGFWVGYRLRGKAFGFLCSAAILTYPEAAIHFRWTRGHPAQGLFALACVGFLICYLQQRRMRDICWAGVMCSLAIGMHYFAYPLIAIIFITAAIVNYRHIPAALATSLAFLAILAVFTAWSDPNGIVGVVNEFQSASKQGFKSVQPSIIEELWRLYRRLVEFVFLTPTLAANGVRGTDLWILGGCLGLAFFPEKQYRIWLVFFAFSMMLGVFVSRDTVGMFLYQAMGFIPLLAIGFSGLLVQSGERLANIFQQNCAFWRRAPSLFVLGSLGVVSIAGAFGHFNTKIDLWTVRSWENAEKVMMFVNASTDKDDYVIMPDQLFWLFRHDRKAQLIHSAVFDFNIYENLTVGFPKEGYWFDPSLENAKFLVLAAGKSSDDEPMGIDAIFWFSYEGPRKVIAKVQELKWPVVFSSGEYLVLENPNYSKQLGSPEMNQD